MTAKQKKTEKLDFEKAMEKLETIVDQLESGELTLENSITAFEKGIELSKYCHKQLEAAEGRVKKLIEKTDGDFDLELFGDEEEDNE